ncbi:hypothetical protein EDEG_03881 [Edhazardia aedis USNM 41457]|uniref:Uncharacterized protein n=1 Tax=Edhazardia aedis (strain USNM 41457) TaxID=1003232 RepID=J9D1W3_EDHAE|nr:hypothetical protein EDEG_03881 [Edhazardia aedis USNM 41457]|eukprot:EJW01554.1 hypothetical protein EDEG_03881 [Edhazardia aedis USNM 41457]
MLKNWHLVFKNKCLIKILKKCNFRRIVCFFTRNVDRNENLNFENAVNENNSYDLRILFNDIIVTTDDLKDLLLNSSYLTISEVLFSRGFFINSQIGRFHEFPNIARRIETELSNWGITIPEDMIDSVDFFFKEDPLQMSDSFFATSDKLVIFKCHISGITRNPQVGNNLREINYYPSADFLTDAWQRLKKRLGPEFHSYFSYKEKERFFTSKFILKNFYDISLRIREEAWIIE